MRMDGVVLGQYPKPRGKMYEPRCSVNVKNASSRTNERDAEGVTGMEMEMEKNYT